MQRDILARARLVGCAIATAREGLSVQDDKALLKAVQDMLSARRKDVNAVLLENKQPARLQLQ